MSAAARGQMRAHFEALAEILDGEAGTGQDWTAWFDGEDSDFVRLNRGRVRQPGTVWQRTLHVRWIEGARHATVELDLSGELEADVASLRAEVARLKERVPQLPEDPHLLWNTEGGDSSNVDPAALVPAEEAVEQVVRAAQGLDLVGIYAAGTQACGFASSRGQRCWDEGRTFHLDWCLYHQADKAVKSSYAGTRWSEAELEQRMAAARERLEVVRRPVKTVPPGEYRVYLSPAAVAELMGTLSYGGFGLKSHETRTTALLPMLTKGARFDPRVSIWEDTGRAPSPAFQSEGFLRPERVPLISEGALAGTLVSPRSAREYGVQPNGAGGWELPEALAMGGGDLDEDDVLDTLGTGIWVSNLWYLNYSDRSAGRVTGMTRFATCWVEDGEVVAPLSVMRFDETFFRLFGSELVGLTREPELQLSANTYFRRSFSSTRVPGVVVANMRFTL